MVKTQLIHDWRSKNAQFYYMKTQNMFSENNQELIVTRRFDYVIENFILKNINPQFVNVGLENSNNGIVLDPFLISLLKDKRKTKKLEDIIMTIQNKQYEILSYDPNSSLLVQGCAGSGKTMVLIHRISYLVFNKYYQVQDILILTQNNSFYGLLDGLLTKLEISSVENLPSYTVKPKNIDF